MSIISYVMIGAFVGLIGGVVFGTGDTLIHYHYPYNPHLDIYPLPITIVLIGGGDGPQASILGAILGGIRGVRVRSVQTRQRKVEQVAASDPRVWPPPPAPPTV
jgi:hypothetical protein